MDLAANYIVEVRDRTFKRLGQIAPEYLDLKFSEVFRSVGAWEMKLPAEHPLLPDLKTKGSGIIVTQVSSGYVFSGRMQSCTLSQDATDPKGTWVIKGVDDNVVAAATTVYPDPNSAANLQTTGYWVSSGNGETVMKSAVNLNAGASAPLPSRRYSWLTTATNSGRGSSVTASARFDSLGDLLTSLGIAANLGWRFRQVGSGVVFDVFVPSDKSATVQLDIRNGGLESSELGYAAPTATQALVMGQGQGEARTVRVVTSTAANAEAALWGLRWEVPKDQRNTDDPTELEQAGQEILTEQGSTVNSLKVTPSDAPNQRVGIDWGLGDIITVIIDGTPAKAVVTEIAKSISSAGVIVQATVGDPVGFDWEAKVSSAIKDQDTRINALERLVDTNPNPTSYSWGTVTGLPGNKAYNPAAAVDTTGWTSSQNGTGVTSIARASGLSGAPDSTAFKVTLTTLGTATYFGLQNSVLGYEMPVTPGQTVVGSAYIRPSVSKTVQFNIEFRDASHAYLSNLPSPPTATPAANAWVQLTQSGVVPAGAAYAYIIARISVSPAVNDFIYVTSIQLGTGTVSPPKLQVLLDGASVPLTMSIDSLEDPRSLNPLDRVRMAMTTSTATLLGTASGVKPGPWYDISPLLASGTTYTPDATFPGMKARRVGPNVEVVMQNFTIASMSVGITGNIANTTILANLPEMFRPAQPAAMVPATAGRGWGGYVTADGQIAVAWVVPSATMTGTETWTNEQYSGYAFYPAALTN